MQRQPPPDTTIALAIGMILAMLLLAVPAIVTAVRPPSVPSATAIVPAVPTAVVMATAAVVATTAPAGPPTGAPGLPATLPAGATPDDRMFTVYAGWPYLPTGARQGDSCELEIWPDGRTPSDRLWIDCSPVGL